KMLNYIIRRLVIAIFLLIGIAIVSFVVIKLPPGDFASRYRGFLLGRGATEEDADRQANLVRQEYGLDQPIAVQFLDWVKGIVTQGNFGYSLAYRIDVGVLIADRLPKTLIIAILSHLISTVVGVGLGIYVATRKYGFWDNVLAVVSFILTSVPRFS